jgi:uncharacterized phage-like protein YoqJ
MSDTINTAGKRVAVVGSRTFNDKEKLYSVLDKNKDKIKLIVSGGAKGADSLATEWAADNGIPYLVFPPKWYTDDGNYDRGAGFRRNNLIVKHSDVVFAFYDGESKGTKNTMEIAERLKKPLKKILFTPPPKPIEPPVTDSP